MPPAATSSLPSPCRSGSSAWPGGSHEDGDTIGAGTYHIYAGDYAFTPVVTHVTGTVTVKINNNTAKTVSESYTSVTLEPVVNGDNILTVTGSSLKIHVVWRGGLL